MNNAQSKSIADWAAGNEPAKNVVSQWLWIMPLFVADFGGADAMDRSSLLDSDECDVLPSASDSKSKPRSMPNSFSRESRAELALLNADIFEFCSAVGRGEW